jgi:hypothetical protein
MSGAWKGMFWADKGTAKTRPSAMETEREEGMGASAV